MLNTVIWKWNIIVTAKTLKSGCHHPRRIMNISRMRAEEGTLGASGRRDLEGSKNVIGMGDCGSEVCGLEAKRRGDFKKRMISRVNCS